MKYNWQQILSDYGPVVWRTVHCLLGNEADARDCYQTVFMEVFQFSQTEEVKDWTSLLKKMARQRALDTLRKRYRQANHIDPAADTAEAMSRFPTPDQIFQEKELAAQLRIALAQLSPRQAEVFVMRYVEQLTYEQISQKTGSNTNAVGALLNRARKQLNHLLEPNVDSTLNQEEHLHD